MRAFLLDIHHKTTTHLNTTYEAGTLPPVALVDNTITMTQVKRKENSKHLGLKYINNESSTSIKGNRNDL